ncbi:MAG TPA: response regulator [Anaerolineae bacterium]|nr:response regulator [Anaerolineae bacterium]HQI84837.1 response regulator [Anaerolineae bacterium]
MSPALLPLLVVGDDASFCYLMQRYAQKAACPVVTAHFADDALDIALRQTPLVVIVELDTPGDKGLHILNALKAHPLTRSIPVILCSWTAEADPCLDEGAALYLRKPILYDDFQTALADVGVDVNSADRSKNLSMA